MTKRNQADEVSLIKAARDEREAILKLLRDEWGWSEEEVDDLRKLRQGLIRGRKRAQEPT